MAALTSVKKFTIGDESVEVLGSPSVILKDRTGFIFKRSCKNINLNISDIIMVFNYFIYMFKSP